MGVPLTPHRSWRGGRLRRKFLDTRDPRPRRRGDGATRSPAEVAMAVALARTCAGYDDLRRVKVGVFGRGQELLGACDGDGKGDPAVEEGKVAACEDLGAYGVVHGDRTCL